MMQINTKRQFYDLWLSGQLGNRMGAWTGDEYLSSDFRTWDYINCLPFVGIRSLVPGGDFKMPVDPWDIVDVLRSSGISLEEQIVCEGTPEQYDPNSPCKLIVQGELVEGVGGWYFYHSFSKEPMRAALSRHGRHAVGVGVKEYIRSICTQGSFDEIECLFESYPGHVIELAVYTRCLGNTPNRNVVIWEVRNY